MRRYSVFFVLAISIVILSYVAENEVTAAASPAPCFFDLLPKRKKPKDDDDKPDKDKEKDKKIPKLLDQMATDFKELMKMF